MLNRHLSRAQGVSSQYPQIPAQFPSKLNGMFCTPPPTQQAWLSACLGFSEWLIRWGSISSSGSYLPFCITTSTPEYETDLWWKPSSHTGLSVSHRLFQPQNKNKDHLCLPSNLYLLYNHSSKTVILVVRWVLWHVVCWDKCIFQLRKANSL